MTDIYSEEFIQELISWAESAQVPNGPFRLSEWEYIENPQTFLSTDLNYIKANYKEKLLLCKPAILRLSKLKEYMSRL